MFDIIDLGILLVFISGYCKGVVDTILFHYEGSSYSKYKNQRFFDPLNSWKNKYKEDLKTPKFLGSTTIFVMFTDLFHLAEMIRTTSLIIGIGIVAFNCRNIEMLIGCLAISRLVYGIGFWNAYKIVR